jgi:hypothetical protein
MCLRIPDLANDPIGGWAHNIKWNAMSLLRSTVIGKDEPRYRWKKQVIPLAGTSSYTDPKNLFERATATKTKCRKLMSLGSPPIRRPVGDLSARWGNLNFAVEFFLRQPSCRRIGSTFSGFSYSRRPLLLSKTKRIRPR